MNKLSRSIRNNNPLNIRLGKSRWQGLRKMQEDGLSVSLKAWHTVGAPPSYC